MPTSSTAVRWSALFDDVELTAAEIAPARRRGAAARALARRLGRARQGRPGRGRRGPRRARRRPRSSPAPRCCATPSASRAPTWPATVQVHGGGWAADLLAKSADVASDLTTTPPGFEGELRSLPGRGTRLAGLPRLGRARRLPGARHGPRQDARRCWRTCWPQRDGPALVIAPPAVVGNWAAEAARFTPELRVVVHHGASRASAPTSSPTRSPTPTSSSPPTAPRCATSTRCRARRGTGRARRGAGHQEPGQRDRPAAPPHQRPQPHRAHRHAHRERPRRPVGHPRLHQPGPRGHAAARSSRSSRPTGEGSRQRPRTRCGRSTASSCSGAPRPSPRSPPSCPSASTSSTTAP